MHMERKRIPAMILLEDAARMTIAEIPAHAGNVLAELMAEADSRGMAITGPCIFIYEGCDGKPDTRFTLRIGFPVSECAGRGAFDCRELPEHECLATTYQGPMDGIGAAWARFSAQAVQSGLALEAVGREVYVHWVDHVSPDNLTELQIPIKA